NQQLERIGDVFIKQAGFANWADANRLVLLYPQVTTTTLNPQACWDWWGYTGRDYLTRNGPQIEAVRRMLDRLAGHWKHYPHYPAPQPSALFAIPPHGLHIHAIASHPPRTTR